MIKLMNSSSNNQPVVESLALYTKTLHDRLLFCSQLEFTSLKSEVSIGFHLDLESTLDNSNYFPSPWENLFK